MNLQLDSPTTSPAALLSDAILVAAARAASDPHAFTALITRYQRAALATCLAILLDRQLAEDAAQDTFIAAYRNLHSLRDPSSFGGWLMSIARNRASRLAKNRAKHPSAEWAIHSPNIHHPPPPLPDESLLTALATLPDHERSVVMLRYFDGHDISSISTITGRPVGTVTKQLSRAHTRLRKALKEKP